MSNIVSFFTTLFGSNETVLITHSALVGLFAIGAVKLGRGALTAFVVVCWIVGNFFVIKQATIFGFDVITTDGLAIGANVGLNLLESYYGKKAAKNGIWIGFYMILFFLTLSMIQLLYIPNSFDCTHTHFVALLSSLPRIVLSSCCVALLSMNLNLYLFEYFSTKFKNQLGLNTILAVGISQIIDTFLFTIFALSGAVASMVSIIVFSSSIKLLACAITVPVIMTVRRFITPHETL